MSDKFIKNSFFLVADLGLIQFDSEAFRCFDLLVNLCGAIYLQTGRTRCFIKACLGKWTGVTFQLCGAIEWVGISGHICEITPVLTLSLCMLPSHLGVSTDTPGHRNTNTSQTAAFQLHRHRHTHTTPNHTVCPTTLCFLQMAQTGGRTSCWFVTSRTVTTEFAHLNPSCVNIRGRLFVFFFSASISSGGRMSYVKTFWRCFLHVSFLVSCLCRCYLDMAKHQKLHFVKII